jgi:dsDNA-specific endonuclease/ATPase MutS2
MFTLGDTVEAIDDALSGKVVDFKNNKIVVETNDGFLLEFTENEIVATSNQLDLMKTSGGFYSKKDEPVKTKNNPKPLKTKRNEFVLEVDLHIEKLVPSRKGMSNFDILDLQLATAKRQLEFAINKRFPKVVFIHGVGEGILKTELQFLFGRYDNSISHKDASYQEYGLGATEVTIRQNSK